MGQWPWMESGCGWQGQERDPWFLVDEDLGDGLLPWQEGFGGEEVRLETSGRALISPGVLWLPKPRALLLPCAVVAAGFWECLPRFGCPSVKSEMKTSRIPAGMLGPREEQPLPSPPPSPHGDARAAVALPRAPGTGWAILKTLQDPPKQSLTAKPSPNTDQRGSKPPSLLGKSPALALGAARKCPEVAPRAAPAAAPQGLQSLGFLVHSWGIPAPAPALGEQPTLGLVSGAPLGRAGNVLWVP